MRPPRLVSLIALALPFFVLLVGVPSPAQGAHLGKNGFISFAGAKKGEPSDIWTVDPDGTGYINLTKDSRIDSEPTVSPEGGPHIAWVSTAARCSPCLGDIYVMDNDGDEIFNATKTDQEDERSPSFAPSGGRIAYARRVLNRGQLSTADIWVMNWTGEADTRVRLTTDAANDIQPIFSPDARHIAFVSNRGGSYSIYTMNLRGDEVTMIAPRADSPDWHPLATQLVFIRLGNVWVVNADGTKEQQLTQSGKDAVPVFSPDGERILFQRGGVVMAMKAGGSGVHRLTKLTMQATDPDWRPDCHKFGTPGPDTIRGTSEPELLCGAQGDDTIFAGGGDDRVYAGSGEDLIDLGDGNDFAIGGNEAYTDRMYGGAGDDYMMGVQGDDVMNGGLGSDTMLGGPGDDRLLGTDGIFGNDTLVGEDKEERHGDTCSGDVGIRESDRLLSCEIIRNL